MDAKLSVFHTTFYGGDARGYIDYPFYKDGFARHRSDDPLRRDRADQSE